MSKYAEIWEYDERLIRAVEYLIERGITKSTEIAKRLGISPWTVRNIKYILRKMKEEKKEEKKEGEKEEEEKSKDVLEEILGGE